MRHQSFDRIARRISPIIVDEDNEILGLIEDYRNSIDSEPSGSADPRSLLLSMSDYDKSHNYDVYDLQTATRPEQDQHYASFAAAHPQYPQEYVNSQSQATTNLPQVSDLSFLPPSQTYTTAHDQLTYYTDPTTQYTPFLEVTTSQLPGNISFSPNAGSQGTKVSVYFQCSFDLQAHSSQAVVLIMFGHKRCDSVLSKTSASSSPYQYVLQADAPAFATTGSGSETLTTPLTLALDGPPRFWQTNELAVGDFQYIDDIDLSVPPPSSRKRKLSFDAGERLSPTKKQSLQQLPKELSTPAQPTSSFSLHQGRRFSQPEYQGQALPSVHSQQFFTQPSSATARLQAEHSPLSYGYYPAVSVTRSPTVVIPASRSSQILPSPSSSNPPLIRTSTIQQPAPPGLPNPLTQTFNPYAMYPANTKAMLKIEGDLHSMVENWTEAEWDTKRRLVQFQRSQLGSVITTTFEPVSPEERQPNSICVSCIWWEEKQECYVTSVDTIQLLESLVAVRFTVEEKNRIRRNLEGFRPATVSKQKSDSEDFFKLIMGFPNPKPRNIEKDVKVFPWRILSTALKKIISKYSASYSSTAGALHSSPSSSSYARRTTDTGMDHRLAASPHSTSSSVTSHGHAYATAIPTPNYVPSTASTSLRGGMSAGPPDLRLAVPSTGQASYGWHQPATHYATPGVPTELSTSASTGRTPSSWDYNTSLTAYSMTPNISSASSQYHFGPNRVPASTGQPINSTSGSMSDQAFISLHDYEQSSQPTTSNA